jgi:hypothetical protein
MNRLTQGDIIWLKKRIEIDDNDITERGQPHAGCFNHPVVILYINQAKTEATILTASKVSAYFL